MLKPKRRMLSFWASVDAEVVFHNPAVGSRRDIHRAASRFGAEHNHPAWTPPSSLQDEAPESGSVFDQESSVSTGERHTEKGNLTLTAGSAPVL